VTEQYTVSMGFADFSSAAARRALISALASGSLAILAAIAAPVGRLPKNSKVASPTRERRDFAWTLRLWVRRGSERKHVVAHNQQQWFVSPQQRALLARLFLSQ
jgi:hypothetical protein